MYPRFDHALHLYPINGAAHGVGQHDTAWSNRDANFVQVIVGVDQDPANNPQMIKWAQDYWDALHPHSAGGGHVNMMMDEGEARVKAAHRDNYDRPAAFKANRRQKYLIERIFEIFSI